MDLKTFVRQSLVEVAQGVAEAKPQLAEVGARANPDLATGPANGAGPIVLGYAEGGAAVFLVDFDVAVTTAEGKGATGGIGVLANAFTVGTRGESKSESSAASRIRFTVPLALPQG